MTWLPFNRLPRNQWFDSLRRLSMFALLSVGMVTAYPAHAGLFEGSDARVAVVGIKKELRDNVLAYLQPLEATLRSADMDQPRIVKSVKTALSALGYFHPEINISDITDAGNKKSPPPILIKIKKGPPTLLKQINVQIIGDGAQFEPFVKLLSTLPKEGTVLNQGTYETFKAQLNSIALTYGFFHAHFEKAQLGVSLQTNQAVWDIVFNTGPRWNFGSLRIENSQVIDQLITSLSPFKAGEPYDAALVNLYNRNLSATGWFSSAIVTPETENLNTESDIPMVANVTMRKKNAMDIGLGVSSDIGIHGKISWQKPWLNKYGHSLKTNTEISKPEQVQDFTYKVPVKHAPLTDYWTYQIGYKHQKINDTDQTRYTAGISRFHETSNNWKLSASIRYSTDNFTQAQVHQRSNLLMPGVSATRTRSNGGLAPSWGDTQRYSLDFAVKGIASDNSFTRVKLEAALLRTYWNKHRFFVRGTMGAIATQNFISIPPDLRFFAGGDGSIRGYKYNSVSPTNSQGLLTGGRFLSAVTLEYRYNLYGNFWTSAFIDAGEVVNNLKDFSPKKGAGFGLRYISPVGPIKLDIARPIGDPSQKKRPWKFYIGLGSEL